MGFRIIVLITLMLPFLCLAQDTTRKLKEVEVRDRKEGNFGHLYQVDGMKITAGKKSEVIKVEQRTTLARFMQRLLALIYSKMTDRDCS